MKSTNTSSSDGQQSKDFVAHDPMCVMILSTAPDILLAKRIAHVLVEEHLAACVQLTPPMLSVYEWQGVIQGDEEIGMVIKTSRAVARQTIDRLVELHPYEIPQATVVPIVGGYFPYLNWVSEQSPTQFVGTSR